MRKLITTLILGCIVFVSNANDALTYLEKMRANYINLSTFSIQMNYTLYKGYEGKNIIESYPAFFYSNGKNAYRKMKDIEILSQDDKMITMYKSAQTMVLSTPTEIPFQDIDFDEVLQKSSHLSVEIKGKHRVVHLAYKTNQSNPYSKVSIEIDQKFMIKKITMFFAKRVNFSKKFGEKDMGFPRLEIDYTAFSKKWKDKLGLVNIQKYITAIGQDFVVTEQYKNYELIDLRLANKN